MLSSSSIVHVNRQVHYRLVSCVEIRHIARKFHKKTRMKQSCKKMHAKIHEKEHAILNCHYQ